MADGLSKLFEDSEFRSTNLTGGASPENLFSILESLEDASNEIIPFSPFDESLFSLKGSDENSQTINTSQKSNNSGVVRPRETDKDDDEASLARKKFKFAATPASSAEGAQEKISHITVERNRRKQMNEHVAVLRSLMPCFYVKRGDQASIIGGVADYIKELQQVLQSLEAKKQRKAYSEVLSPRSLVSSPRPPLPSPMPSPLSPRIALPVSPRTPQPTKPLQIKPRNIQPPYYNNNNNNLSSSHESSPISLDSSTDQLAAANSNSPVADVEVKFSGPNVLLNTVSQRIPGQTMKIISALEGHSLEILHVDINTINDTMLNSFTIKIGIECELSAEELAQEILQTFS